MLKISDPDWTPIVISNNKYASTRNACGRFFIFCAATYALNLPLTPLIKHPPPQPKAATAAADLSL
ncbi:hypothetical protein [Acetobacterium sp. MES1]|uniref:hypothetical protein n=1 Tax=Acetobacterium sp. MES1 TaxID=1899015 RepID=UPI00257DE763|nr:hypothetical protein [Acetobacterium sp. MES1]